MNKAAHSLTTSTPTCGKLVVALIASLGFSSAAVARTELGPPLGQGRTQSVSSGFVLPFPNSRVTSGFNQGRRHPAIDLAGPMGTPVVATTSSQRVSFAGPRGGYGNTVIARDALGRTHLYAHLQSITTRVGHVLDQGQKLGTLGSTGFSTGPHVHYEVKNTAGVHLNPAYLLFPRRISTRSQSVAVGHRRAEGKGQRDRGHAARHS